jgi:hypothetical protein
MLATGGYDNQPDLKASISALSYLYLLSNVGQRFFDDPLLGKALLADYPKLPGPLTPELALHLTASAACRLGACLPGNWESLEAHGLAPSTFPPKGPLTRGEAYALAADVAKLQPDANDRENYRR